MGLPADLITLTRVTIPARFWDDHRARDCNRAGIEVGRTTSRVTITLDEHGIAELVSDAQYYATEWRYMGRQFIGLGRSAAATLAALDKIGN